MMPFCDKIPSDVSHHLLFISVLLLSFAAFIGISTAADECTFMKNCTCINSDAVKNDLKEENLFPVAKCVNTDYASISHFFDPKLRSLVFSGNLLTKLGHDLQTYKSLEWADLSGNKIEEIRGEDFRGNLMLRRLDLSENKIRRLEKGSFQQLKLLKVLILKGNLIGNFFVEDFVGLQALEMLDLAENQLTDLELLYASNLAAASAPNLSRLSLHHNHLTTASFRASTDTNATNTTTDTAGVFLGHPVQFLDLSYTGVDSLPLVIQHFPNLVSLNLSYCGIDDGRLAGLDAGVQLREVVLRGNLFTEITDYPRKKGITLDVAGTDVQCACWMVGVLDAGEQQWKGLDCMTDPARLTALRALCAAPGVGSHLFLPLLVIIGALLVIGAAFSCYLCYRYRPQMYSDWLRCTCLRKLCGNRHEDRKPSELMAFVSATNSSTPTMQSVSPTPELHDPAQFIRAHAQPVLHDAGDPRRVFEKNDDSASDDEEEDSLYEVIGSGRQRDCYVNQRYIDAQSQPVTEL